LIILDVFVQPLPNSLYTLIFPPSYNYFLIQVDLFLVKRLCILKCKGGLIDFFSMSLLPKNLYCLNYIKSNLEPLDYFWKALENSEYVILFWMDDVMERLPKSFKNLRKSEELNLSDCRSLVELLDSFGGLHNLKNLNFHWSGIQSLLESFGKLSLLEELECLSWWVVPILRIYQIHLETSKIWKTWISKEVESKVY